ncbi:MAG: GHKL domain-containing protein [Clostridia bacterium]|nr:GHKL domain-containing protein [Clostridia bacterium]
MSQFLNNFWTALSTENVGLVNLILIPATIIELSLFMCLFLIILNIKASKWKKLIYILATTCSALINRYIIPNPINVLVNYAFMLLFIKFIFRLNWLNSFVAILLSIFTSVLIIVPIENLYIMILGIDKHVFLNTPIHRLVYFTILYSSFFLFVMFIRRYKNIQFNLAILDTLDRRTLLMLILNLFIGFLTLCIQLITSVAYSHIVPAIINILNFVLLISFLILNIYNFSRIIKLAYTRRDLQNAEEYNKSLEILYDKVKGFQHDFNNIVYALDGYINDNDMVGLKTYFDGMKTDCKITNNLSILNPRIINNPGIYSLLNNKYFKAINLGVTFDIKYFIDLKEFHINTYEFSRILGILIDNAIEEAEKCEKKIVEIMFRKDFSVPRALIVIKNTYTNKDVDINEIFKKGFSSKENHFGIGLWEVKKYISKTKNLNLVTTKDNEFFKHELSIYD